MHDAAVHNDSSIKSRLCVVYLHTTGMCTVLCFQLSTPQSIVHRPHSHRRDRRTEVCLRGYKSVYADCCIVNRVPALKPIIGRRAVVPDVDQPARLPRG